jgi:hypothetical protein
MDGHFAASPDYIARLMAMTVGDLLAALSGPLLDLRTEHQVQHLQTHRRAELFEAVLGPALQGGQACGLFSHAL